MAHTDIAAIAESTATDLQGVRRRLGDFWVDRAVVLVFLRHFG